MAASPNQLTPDFVLKSYLVAATNGIWQRIVTGNPNRISLVLPCNSNSYWVYFGDPPSGTDGIFLASNLAPYAVTFGVYGPLVGLQAWVQLQTFGTSNLRFFETVYNPRN